MSTNPYFNRLTIREDCDFFGRRRELDTIFKRIGAEVPQSISIVGERRIGKSSLLRAVLNRRYRALPRPDEFLFVWLDLHALIHGDVETFFAALLGEIAFARKDTSLGRLEPTYKNVGAIGPLLVRDRQTLVILLDEFDCITRNKNFTFEFFSFLRSLPGSYPVAFVVTSVRDLQHLCHSEEIAGSPFFNIFQPLNLGSFTEDEARELIIGPSSATGCSLEPYADSVFRLGGYFPFSLQIACCAVLDYLGEQPWRQRSSAAPLTRSDEQVIGQRFLDEARGFFENIWEHLDTREKTLFAKIARHNKLRESDLIYITSLNRRGYVYLQPVLRLFSGAFEEYVLARIIGDENYDAQAISDQSAAESGPRPEHNSALLCMRVDAAAALSAEAIVRRFEARRLPILEANAFAFETVAAALAAGRTLQSEIPSSDLRIVLDWGPLDTLGGAIAGDGALRALAILDAARCREFLVTSDARAALPAEDARHLRSDRSISVNGMAVPVEVFACPAEPVAPTKMREGSQVGRFTILTQLGTGGMGEVYLAEDTALKRRVALKRLKSSHRGDIASEQRFRREAQRLSALANAHIAGLFDLLEQPGETFLVMEYVEGRTLRTLIKEPLPVEMVLDIAEQCAMALVEAHDKGIVHCDVKPENIMITTGGLVKVLDFGIARAFQREEDQTGASTMTFVGEATSFAGTPAYAAPESIRSQPLDGRTDIFSLGVVLYEMLTTTKPFGGSSFFEITDGILHNIPPSVSVVRRQVPDGVSSIVARCLQKNPNHRYATARDLLQDLHIAQRRLKKGSNPARFGWLRRLWQSEST